MNGVIIIFKGENPIRGFIGRGGWEYSNKIFYIRNLSTAFEMALLNSSVEVFQPTDKPGRFTSPTIEAPKRF